MFVFQKQNYLWLLIGIAVNVIGFILMIGGASEDPNVFKYEEIFSPIRLTVAPIMIIAGYILMIFAIMKKPAKKS